MAAKTQRIRLLDVYALGPMMIVLGVGAQRDYPLLGPAVALGGVATIIFNARNYQRIRRARRRGEREREE